MPITINVGGALQLPLPLYALRAHDRLYEQDGYILIDTVKDTYILDCPMLGAAIGMTYTDRRMALRKQDLDYPIYPLSELYTSILQLAHSKRRLFIGSDGKIYKYKPTDMCKLEYGKIIHKKLTDRGSTVVFVQGVPVPFKIQDDGDYSYVGYIKHKRGYIAYDLCHERKPTTRKKV